MKNIQDLNPKIKCLYIIILGLYNGSASGHKISQNRHVSNYFAMTSKEFWEQIDEENV